MKNPTLLYRNLFRVQPVSAYLLNLTSSSHARLRRRCFFLSVKLISVFERHNPINTVSVESRLDLLM